MSTQSKLDFSSPQQPRTAALRSLHVHGGNPSAEEAIRADARAMSQEARLVDWWTDHLGAQVTRHDVARILGCCEVSAGRVLSNLLRGGFLRKRLDLHVPGPYGATVHPYELVR